MVEPTEVNNQIDEDDFLDRAKGCIVGAFLGDSIGSFLEFKEHITDDLLEKALEMPGGGPFKLSPGQITDDSELATCLLHALVESKGKFSLEKIAWYYREWMNSPPFDLGNTIAGGIEVLLDVGDDITEGLAKLCIDSAKDNNQGSQSNGGVMRITPLAVWCSNLESIEDLRKVVEADQVLTHPNNTTVDAAVVYCIAIRHLLRNKGDIKGTLASIEEYIKTSKTLDPDIKTWWSQVESGQWMPGNPKMGWLKIAWTYTFLALKFEELDYLKIIRKVLSKAGDTDTNACIVGGVIGAALGFEKLKSQAPDQLEKLLALDATKAKVKRPEMYTSSKTFELIKDLVKLAPTKLNVEKKLEDIKNEQRII